MPSPSRGPPCAGVGGWDSSPGTARPAARSATCYPSGAARRWHPAPGPASGLRAPPCTRPRCWWRCRCRGRPRRRRRSGEDDDPPAVLTPLHALGALQAVELHRGELLVARLAHPVDQRRNGHPPLLPPKLLVQLEQLVVELGHQLLPDDSLLGQLRIDPPELLDGFAPHRLEPGPGLLNHGAGLPRPRLEVVFADHLLQEVVLGPGAAVLERGDLVLEGLHLLDVGDAPVVQPLLVDLGFAGHRVDLPLQALLLPEHRIHAEPELPQAALRVLHRGPGIRHLLALLQLALPSLQSVDRAVELLEFQQPIQATHRTKRSRGPCERTRHLGFGQAQVKVSCSVWGDTGAIRRAWCGVARPIPKRPARARTRSATSS